MTANDGIDLERFIEAQADVYSQALGELRAGRKRTHWMWFVLPQLRGLGYSEMAQFYGIAGVEEARAYLEHETLGPRLRECMAAVLAVEGRTALEIMGSPDDLKLRSCATLFAAVSEKGSVFEQVLGKYFEGEKCARTVAMLGDRQ
jgi:uncharacterized protein (DUF1810 family)